MSTEILEIVQQMDLHNAETQLALQCAPLIAGVKISNLLVVSTGMEDAVKQCLRKSGISFLLLLRTREKARYLLFRKKPLEAYLMRKEIRELLQESGYKDFTLGNILNTFQKRYQGYMNGEPGFPHEMGVLLGYPVEDVRGFMEQNGQNALYQGYWKVYAHVPEKKHLFARYDMEKETIIQLLSNGVKMQDIIGIYNDSLPQKAAV